MDIDKITTTKMDLLQKSIEREFGKEISHIVASAMTGVIATIFLNSALHGVSATKTLDAFIKVVQGLDQLAADTFEAEGRAKFN